MSVNFINAKTFERLTLHTLNRSDSIFDLEYISKINPDKINFAGKDFLILGAAGFIGSKLILDLIELGADKMTLVDQNENNLVNLNRNIRSKFWDRHLNVTLVAGDFFELFVKEQYIKKSYDVIIFVAAYKHVRTERNVFSAINLIYNNAIKWDITLKSMVDLEKKQVFVLSTDKANSPVNYMGLSKLIMEHSTWKNAAQLGFSASAARFANVAFSSGSLLESWITSYSNDLPLVLPRDTKRFFLTSKEASTLCLLSLLHKEENAIIVPNHNSDFLPESFETLAERFLDYLNLKPVFLETIPDRSLLGKYKRSQPTNVYPVIRTPRNTSGEKEEEILISAENKVIRAFKNYSLFKPEQINSESFNFLVDTFSNPLDVLERHGTFDELEKLLKEVFSFFTPLTLSESLDDRL